MIYLNGTYVQDGPHIHTQDRGFLLGDGVFETVLVRNHRAIFLSRHLARLKHACSLTKIPYEPQRDEIIHILDRLVQSNKIDHTDHVMRLTVTRGPGARGLAINPAAHPTLLVALTPCPAFPDHLSWMVSTYQRSSVSIHARVKSLAYGDNILAFAEAKENDADEAVMMNEAGDVSCASRSNLFLLSDQTSLRTPATKAGALPGIIRGWVLEQASAMGMRIDETAISVDQLNNGFVFFTNSLMGLKSGSSHGAPVPAFFRQLTEKYAMAIVAQSNGQSD